MFFPHLGPERKFSPLFLKSRKLKQKIPLGDANPVEGIFTLAGLAGRCKWGVYFCILVGQKLLGLARYLVRQSH
jgi:hypothetical protein